MRDRQGSHRWGPAAAAVLLVIIPLLYPLSVGPAILLDESMGSPQSLRQVLEPIYEPLDWLPEPLYSMLERYADLWRR